MTQKGVPKSSFEAQIFLQCFSFSGKCANSEDKHEGHTRKLNTFKVSPLLKAKSLLFLAISLKVKEGASSHVGSQISGRTR